MCGGYGDCFRGELFGLIPDMRISDQFRARLDQFPPRHKVRAIIMLRSGSVGKPAGRRQSAAERRAAVEAVRETAKSSLAGISGVLELHAGRCLADAPDALGSMPVETTVAGIKALAASRHVKAILEDQPVSIPSL